MVTEKYKDDLLALENAAKRQGNKLNLSIILITLKYNEDEIQEIIGYLSEKSIEIVYDDVEPDSEETYNEAIDGNTVVNPFDPSRIDIKMDKLSMDSIIKRIKNEEFEFNSSFQRKSGLWNKMQKSQLIESILLRIPLPAFYFDASDDDKWLLIDGLQRISTIKEYVVDESFSLYGMEFLTDLNGLKFSELPRALQRRIEETNINAYLVNPSTPKNVKFNIFKRINTGGLVLEAQEIRNALYQGQAADFISKLANLPEFIKATDGSIKSDRMLDREFCLRFVAFTELPLAEYPGNLEEFLNDAMEYLSKQKTDRLNEIETKFKFVMELSYAIFEKNAFRKIFDDGRRRPVNKAIFGGFSHVFAKLDQSRVDKLIKNKQQLTDGLRDLCDDNSFQNALTASDKTSITNRTNRMQNLVDEVTLC